MTRLVGEGPPHFARTEDGSIVQVAGTCDPSKGVWFQIYTKGAWAEVLLPFEKAEVIHERLTEILERAKA